MSPGMPCIASAIGPAMAATVSESPPSDTALRIASSNELDSRAQVIDSGTVFWHVSLNA